MTILGKVFRPWRIKLDCIPRFMLPTGIFFFELAAKQLTRLNNERKTSELTSYYFVPSANKFSTAISFT